MCFWDEGSFFIPIKTMLALQARLSDIEYIVGDKARIYILIMFHKLHKLCEMHTHFDVHYLGSCKLKYINI